MRANHFFVVFCKISTLSAIDLVKKLCIVILTAEGGSTDEEKKLDEQIK